MEYYASNTDNQVVDTFEAANVKSVSYHLVVQDRNTKSVSEVIVTHDGQNTAETQVSESLDGSMPAEFTTEIVDGIGYLKTTPQHAITSYTFTKDTIDCNLFSENTLSGQYIVGEEGFGIHRLNVANGASDSTLYTVRQEGNMLFGNAASFYDDVTRELEPTTTLEELLDADAFTSYAGSDIQQVDEWFQITSSGQQRNCHYFEVDVIPGEQYRLQAQSYYTTQDVLSKTSFDNQQGTPLITVGDSIGSSEYIQHVVHADTYAIEEHFTPTTDKIYVCFGQGELGTDCFVKDMFLKRFVPFHTFSQNEGCLLLSWENIPSTSSVAGFYNESWDYESSILVNGSDEVTLTDWVTTQILGPEVATNYLALNYSADGTRYSLNGSAPANVSLSLIAQSVFGAYVGSYNLRDFVYMPTMLSDADLVRFTNG